MKTKILFLFFVLLASSGIKAQPRMVFKSKTISVGTVYMTDEPKTYSLKFYNKGSKPLRIIRYGADCQCTMILSCDTIVQPKRSGKLVFKMDLRELFPMEIEKWLMFDTNADEDGVTQKVKIVGELKRRREQK